jgi:hypothetical protein
MYYLAAQSIYYGFYSAFATICHIYSHYLAIGIYGFNAACRRLRYFYGSK